VAVKGDCYRRIEWPFAWKKSRVVLFRSIRITRACISSAGYLQRRPIARVVCRRCVSVRRYIAGIVESVVGEPAAYALSDHVLVKNAPATTPSAVSAR
jgi:hypothetical protein